MLVVVACGGCDPRPLAEADGGGGSGGSREGIADRTASGDAGVCANVACLQTASDLVSGCPISGSCVDRFDYTDAVTITNISC